MSQAKPASPTTSLLDSGDDDALTSTASIAKSAALPLSPSSRPEATSAIASRSSVVPSVLKMASDILEHEMGFAVGVREDRNRHNRRSMEDAHAIDINYGEMRGQGFFGVYDGHAGKQAAKWCGDNLHKTLLEVMEKSPDKVLSELLNETFMETDRQLQNKQIHSGCTAAVSVLKLFDNRRVLYTANAGDARAVLCRDGRAIRLTYDHKGSDNLEAKRIVELGGFIMNDRVNGVLAVTRSLGDASMKDLIIGNPYTTELEIEEDDEFLIIACDGVWDVMTDQDAVNLILGIADPEVAAERLVNKALVSFSTDNITALVVKFNHASYYKLYPAARAYAQARKQSMNHATSDDMSDDADTPTQKSVAAGSGSGELNPFIETECTETGEESTTNTSTTLYQRCTNRGDKTLAEGVEKVQVVDVEQNEDNLNDQNNHTK